MGNTLVTRLIDIKLYFIPEKNFSESINHSQIHFKSQQISLILISDCNGLTLPKSKRAAEVRIIID